MSFVRSALTVSINTLLSRITGFARDILIAKSFGSGDIGDVWVAAFRFPNLFRLLIAEGAFNSAFVPLYTKALKEGEENAKNIASNIFSFMLLIVTAFSILIMLCMPFIMLIFTPGYSSGLVDFLKNIFIHGQFMMPDFTSDEKLRLTIDISTICFPYALCMFVMALFSAMLNSHNRFWESAFAPVLFNIILVSLLLAAPYLPFDSIYVQAWGVLAAGIAQIALVWWGCKRIGVGLRLQIPKQCEHLSKFKKLLLPGLLSGGMMQINLVVGSMIASFQDGAMSYLYYADRVYQLPLGLIGVAISIVLLPKLSKLYHDNETIQAVHIQNRALEFAAFFTIPCSVAMLVIPVPLVSFLFERGAFTHQDSINTALALGAYCFGLPAFLLVKVFSSSFFANQDTKKPMRFALISAFTNIVLSLILFPYFGHVGIATATSIAAWINVLQLYFASHKNGWTQFDARFKKQLFKIILCCLVLGGGLFALDRILINQVNIILHCLILVFSGGIIYLLTAFAIKAISIQDVKRYLKR